MKSRIALLAVSLLLTGCVYRLDISQGNEIDPDTIEQLEIGMSKAQVEFLMGTPALIDPTRPDQWHYVTYFKQGEDGSIQSSSLSLTFEDDILSNIEGELIPRQ